MARPLDYSGKFWGRPPMFWLAFGDRATAKVELCNPYDHLNKQLAVDHKTGQMIAGTTFKKGSRGNNSPHTKKIIVLCHSFVDFYHKTFHKCNYFYIYTNLYLGILLKKIHVESFRQDGFHTFIKLIMGLVVITILIPQSHCRFPL